MPAPIILYIVAKAGGLLLSSFLHGSTKPVLRNDHATAQAAALIKDGTVCLEEESSKVVSCNAIVLVGSQTIKQSLPIVEEQPCPQMDVRKTMVLFGSRSIVGSIVASSTSEELTSVKNASNFSPFQIGSLELFAFWCWYLARITAMMQSAAHSVMIDLKEAFSSFFGSESIVETKAYVSALFQMSTSWFLAKIVDTLKKATRILLSQAKQNISKIVGQLFFIKRRARQPCVDLLQVDTSTDSSTAVDVGKSMLSSLMMFIAYAKQVVRMFFKRSYHRGASALCVMLLISAFIGCNTPLKLVDIDEPRGSPVHDILSSEVGLETSTDFGVSSLVHASPLMISSPGCLSNGADSSVSGSVADLYSASKDVQAMERSTDGDASYPSSLAVWSNDQGTDSFSQSISQLNTDVLAVSEVTWNIERLPSEAAIEVNLFIVISEWGDGELLFSSGFAAAVNMKDISLHIIRLDDRLFTVFSQSIEIEVVSQVPWNVESSPWNSDPLKDLAQLGMSLSTVPASNVHSFNRNSVQLVAKASFDVVKAGSSSLLLYPVHLALILLVLCISRGSDSDSNGTAVTLVSEIHTSFDATDDEAMNVDEWNETVADRPITTVKPARRVSKELHSELGKHWTSPSKRRRRRRKSSRTRSKPKYYQPAWE